MLGDSDLSHIYTSDVSAIGSELDQKKIRKQIMQGLIIKQATDWMIGEKQEKCVSVHGSSVVTVRSVNNCFKLHSKVC